MSNKNSAKWDTKSECDCDFYSEYWEEMVTHTNQDLFESDVESDLCVSLHHNYPRGSFENKKEKSKLSEIVLFPENNQTNFKNCYKDCPLLQPQTLENTRQFQAALSSELSDCPSKTFSSKTFLYVCDGSCKDNLCLKSKIPHLIIAEKLNKEPCFNVIKESHATDEVYQKQPLADDLPTSIQNTAPQISVLCREEETAANIFCECFEQSVLSAEVNKTLDRKSIVSYSSEHICHKKTTSSQLLKEHLECSSVSSYTIRSSQAAEQTYVPDSSEGLTISLTLKAGTVESVGSLAVNISPSTAKEGNEDSQHHALAFKFTESEQNNLFNKLCIAIIPSISCSVLLNPASQEEITSFTKQTRFPKVLVDEPSQPLTTHTKSPESSSPDIPINQVPSTLKKWSASQLLSCKHIHETQSSYLYIKSIPYHEVAPKTEVEKHQLKAYRPVKCAVLTRNKEVRNRPYIISKYNWPNTWTVEPFPYQSVVESVINELEYGFQTRSTTTCHCSPLLDLTVDLLSERCSGTEKFLRVHRKPHKQVGGGKVIPRFSSQYLINPRSSFEKLQYLFPVRKKDSLKMQSILSSCLRQAKGGNKYESYTGKVCSTEDNSNAVGKGLFASQAPADERHSITSRLSRTVNHYTQHSPETLPPSERRHAPIPFLQTETETLMCAGLCPDCKCRTSNSPDSAYIVNKVQPPREGNVVNFLCMQGAGATHSGASQVACEDLIVKRFSVCPCGNVPQCGLFPSADIYQKKPRASPSINQRAIMSESNRVNYTKGTFNTVEACCTNCHSCFPTCFCFQNINRQDASRNQFTKVRFPFENEFPNKNLKDFEEKSNAVKRAERKNDRIHLVPDSLQEFSPSDAQALSPSKDGSRTPKLVMYCPKCCSGCQTAVQHLGTSKEVLKGYSSKQKMLNNCLNRKSIFLMDPGQRTRSPCKCSQEISLFHVDQAEIYKVNRAMLSKREVSDVMQDSSSLIMDGQDENH